MVAPAIKWHGFGFIAEGKERELEPEAFHIGPLPGRKNIALYEMKRGNLRVLAYFKGEQEAFDALCWIDRLALIEDYTDV